jgi:subtilisin-like proprotein convertase family protein
MTPNDPLFASQWHFELIGDIEAIWEDYTGDGVSVGVFDDALEYDHQDLDGNYDASLHFEYDGEVYDAVPRSFRDRHGTSVAGIIASEANNGTGGTGVAFDASLTGVPLLTTILDTDDDAPFVEALRWAQNFDIMSNSWGYVLPWFLSMDGLGAQQNAALGVAIEQGRDGLGTVIVKAAGNGDTNLNGEGLDASRYTISVAATDAQGDVTHYSNFGAALLVAAPAAAVTTDLRGSDGYDSGDYTGGFGGTSAATPVVSGVAALMLEADSELGWRDVRNILAMSAAQTGSDYGEGASGYEVGVWESNGASNWNGGGMTFHGSYGYGMVDAFAAVRMAEVWRLMHGEAATSTNEVIVSEAYFGERLIPDLGVLEIEIPVSDSIRIEDIHVTVDMTHDFSPDLRVFLVAPSGEEVALFYNEGRYDTMRYGFEWTFGVAAARGMDSAGTWTLRIEDTERFDDGFVEQVELAFFGSEIGDDDIYHYTQDLFDLADVESGRLTLSDTNGGTDWLNFAAMGAVDLAANLETGSVGFAGHDSTLTIAAGSQIENVVASDGNDTLTGNALDNRLLGMRGDDDLSGGAGDDTLDGDDGNDLIFGGAGDDMIFGGAGDDSLYGGDGNDVIYIGDGLTRACSQPGRWPMTGCTPRRAGRYRPSRRQANSIRPVAAISQTQAGSAGPIRRSVVT